MALNRPGADRLDLLAAGYLALASAAYKPGGGTRQERSVSRGEKTGGGGGGRVSVDSSDRWRNKELKMVSSLSTGAMASSARVSRHAATSQPLLVVPRARAEDSDSSSSEELQYGPGIVSRLKNKYMSMALREAGSRPPLRRVASMEHVMENEAHMPSTQTRCGRTSSRRESMKRARSVGDIALGSSGSRRNPLKEDTLFELDKRNSQVESSVSDKICVERNDPDKQRPSEADELPAPDIVKTVKEMFEPHLQRKSSTLRSVAVNRDPQPRAAAGRCGGVTVLSNPSAVVSQKGPCNKLPRAMTSKSTASVAASSSLSRAMSSKSIASVAASSPSARLQEKNSIGKRLSATKSAIRSESPKPKETKVARRYLNTTQSLSNVRNNCSSSSVSISTMAKSGRKATSWSNLNQERGQLSKSGECRLSFDSSLSRGSPFPSKDSKGSRGSTGRTRKQIGVIKPTLKSAPPDELNTRKNSLNHVLNSVVEREIAEIGTNCFKRKGIDYTIAVKNERLCSNSISSIESIYSPALESRTAISDLSKPHTQDTNPTARVSPKEIDVSTVLQDKRFDSSSSSTLVSTCPVDNGLRDEVDSSCNSPSSPVLAENSDRPGTLENAVKPFEAQSSTAEPADPQSRPGFFHGLVLRPVPKYELNQPASPSAEDVPPALPEKRYSMKSRTTPDVFVDPAGRGVFNGETTALQKRSQSQQGTMVFDFTTRPNVPDYLEDDGLILSRKHLPKNGDSGYVLLPGFVPGQTSDEDLASLTLLNPPSPCNIAFINANVIIDGRSNLRRRTKTRKLAVSFDVNGPVTHQYISEASSLLAGSSESDASATLGILSNYTPSKQQLTSDSFELGVSPAAHTEGRQSADCAVDQGEQLPPASQTSTVTYSVVNQTDAATYSEVNQTDAATYSEVNQTDAATYSEVNQTDAATWSEVNSEHLLF